MKNPFTQLNPTEVEGLEDASKKIKLQRQKTAGTKKETARGSRARGSAITMNKSTDEAEPHWSVLRGEANKLKKRRIRNKMARK